MDHIALTFLLTMLLGCVAFVIACLCALPHGERSARTVEATVRSIHLELTRPLRIALVTQWLATSGKPEQRVRIGRKQLTNPSFSPEWV